jgi:hypothetical protein
MKKLKLCTKENNNILKLKKFDKYIVYEFKPVTIVNYEEAASYLIDRVWDNQCKKDEYLKILFFIIVKSPGNDYDDVFWWATESNGEDDEEELKLCKELCRHFGK